MDFINLIILIKYLYFKKNMKKEFIKDLRAQIKSDVIFFPFGNKIVSYSSNELKRLKEYDIEDDILNFHPMEKDKLLVLGKNNKKITLFDNDKKLE